MKNKKSLWNTFLQSTKQFGDSLPIILGVILLLGLFQSYVSKELVVKLFSENTIRDTFLGALIGSVSGGQVISGYIIGSVLLDKGVSLYAVTAFLLTWVTVGIIQLPAEISALGRKFAIARNLTSIILSILVSYAVVFTLGVILC